MGLDEGCQGNKDDALAFDGGPLRGRIANLGKT